VLIDVLGLELLLVEIDVLGDELALVEIDVLGDELALVEIDVLGDELALVEIDVLGDELALVEIDVLGDELALVEIDVLGFELVLVEWLGLLLVLTERLGEALCDWSGVQAMTWLICLSPSLPPGSKMPLPLESAHTSWPLDASANSVFVYGSTLLAPAFTMTSE
jgi:hypothetical protein